MHCHVCGSQLPDDVKFCTVCGAEFDEEIVQEEKQPAEAPVVEVIEPSAAPDPFEEELEAPAEEISDDVIVEEEVPAEDDASLDPTSPDFDPRKFAGLDLEAFRPMAAAVEVADEEPEAAEEAPKPGKKKHRRKKRGVAGLVIALIVVVLAAAAGVLYWLTMPVKDLVAEDNFIQYLGLDVDQTVTEFVIDSRETSRLHRQDTLWCSVSLEDGSTHAERIYLMNYRLTTSGWELAAVDELSTETWTVTPLVGASEEELITALIGRPVKFSEEYSYPLTETDLQSLSVISQDTDTAAGTDCVEVSISVVDELIGWTAELTMDMTFDNGWQLAAMTHTEPQIEFKPGMEFEKTEEDLLAVLHANPIPFAQTSDDVTTSVVADGEEQKPLASAAQLITLPKQQISEFRIAKTEFDLQTDTQTVMVEFMLDKQVAKLHVEAKIGYVFDDGWKVDTVTYAPTVEEVVLDGEWQGTYTEGENRIPSVTLTIAQNEDGTDNNVFAFGPSEKSPYFFTGKYYVSDEVDPETLAVTLDATDWVLYYNPGGVTMVGLKGYLLLDEAKITDGSSFSISLQRTVVQTEEAEAPDETLTAREVEVTLPFLTEEEQEASAPAVTPEDLAEPADTAAPAEDAAPVEDAAPAEDAAPVEDAAPAEDPAPAEDAAPAENDFVLPSPEEQAPYLGENETPVF